MKKRLKEKMLKKCLKYIPSFDILSWFIDFKKAKFLINHKKWIVFIKVGNLKIEARIIK